jgi:PqqD family protein of HPr-rel-A system
VSERIPAKKIPIRWKPGELVWRSWGGESVVFHVPSADTHFLSSSAAFVLQRLEKQPLNAIELAEKLTAANGLELDDDLLQHVERLLANLHALALIEPVPS